MRKTGLLVVLLAAVLTGCNGSDDVNLGSGNGGTGGGTQNPPSGGGTTVPVASLVLTSSVASIPADGSLTAQISALALDSSNVAIVGVPVTLSASSGALTAGSPVTGGDGVARSVLSTAGDATPRTITVTAIAGGFTKTVSVAVAPAPPASSIRIGNGVGGAFQPYVVGISLPSISAGGSTTMHVTFVRADNALYVAPTDDPVEVTFNSPCVAAGTAEFRVDGLKRATLETITGQANVTYVAAGCVGADAITANATVGGQALEATGSVIVAPASAGSIEFISATPTLMGLRGMAEASRPEKSTVIFRVRDSSGGPVSGQQVNFALSTAVGGIRLSTPSATTDAQGYVQVVVNAGDVATSVRVSATVAGSTTIATQSSELSISTGIPAANRVSLAAQVLNLEGWDREDHTLLTVRLADRFGNPVPDGTAVAFWSEQGGSINGSCLTETTIVPNPPFPDAKLEGTCSLVFLSAGVRPADGRVSVMATAIGEESFADTNGNGLFDSGTDSFVDASPDPWLDLNESGVYEVGEPFYDFGANGPRDGADGLFNGVLCNGALCNTTSRAIGVSAPIVLVLSGSTAFISQLDGAPHAPITMPPQSSRTIDLWIRDVNGNPMPGHSSVVATVTADWLKVAAPSSVVVPSSALSSGVQATGITHYQFTLRSDVPEVGVFTVTVTTPSGAVTSYAIPITVQ